MPSSCPYQGTRTQLGSQFSSEIGKGHYSHRKGESLFGQNGCRG